MGISTDSKQLMVASNYISNLLEFMKFQGQDPEQLLELSQVKQTTISNPNGKITFKQFQALFLNAIKLCNNPALGLHLGNQLNITAHGLLGYAVMSSPTLKEAIRLVTKYFQIRTPLAEISMQTNQELCHLQVSSCYPLGEFNIIFIETVMSGLTSMLSYLTGNDSPIKEIRFAFPAPQHQAEYNKIFNCPIYFNTALTEVVIYKSILEHPLPLADSAANRLAIENCDEALNELSQTQDQTQQIEQLLFSSKGKFPTFKEVADNLHTSPRTLRRRLEKTATSFQEILARVRFRLAKEQLSSTNLSIHEISYLLGYSDPSNFGRAFKKWSGRSPQTYRDKDCFNKKQP